MPISDADFHERQENARASKARDVELQKVQATNAQTEEFRALRLTIERLLDRLGEKP